MEAPVDARVALFCGIIDHAPLFPPASLELSEALAEDELARKSEHAFALGRLVWPASRLHELPDSDRSLSLLVDGPFEPRGRIEAVEGRFGDDLDALARLADEVYVEVPLDDDLDRNLAEVRRRRLKAKVRCVSEDGRLPAQLGWFLLECRGQEISYKATAGLHHAMRTERENGLLNLLAAAVFGDEDSALFEEDPSAFILSREGFRWGHHMAEAREIQHCRSQRLRSIGSCSFFEPIEELEALGALP